MDAEASLSNVVITGIQSETPSTPALAYLTRATLSIADSEISSSKGQLIVGVQSQLKLQNTSLKDIENASPSLALISLSKGSSKFEGVAF